MKQKIKHLTTTLTLLTLTALAQQPDPARLELIRQRAADGIRYLNAVSRAAGIPIPLDQAELDVASYDFATDSLIIQFPPPPTNTFTNTWTDPYANSVAYWWNVSTNAVADYTGYNPHPELGSRCNASVVGTARPSDGAMPVQCGIQCTNGFPHYLFVWHWTNAVPICDGDRAGVVWPNITNYGPFYPITATVMVYSNYGFVCTSSDVGVQSYRDCVCTWIVNYNCDYQNCSISVNKSDSWSCSDPPPLPDPGLYFHPLYRMSGHVMITCLNGVTNGGNYDLLASPDLTPGATWTVVTNTTSVDDNPIWFVLPTDQATMFYRARRNW